MLIICAGVLISLGFVVISTSNTGKMLTQKNVNYAEYTMAKNAAHTAIQIAMQEINQDNDWPNTHDINNPWVTTIQDREVALYMEYYQDANYWDPDSLWIYSNASYRNDIVQVRSLYLKQPFSSLVPEFKAAIQLPTGFASFNIDGNAHGVNGKASHCDNDMPPIITNTQEAADRIPNSINMDGSIEVDPTLNYQPTDELVERLYNSGNANMVNGDWSGPLGTEDNPGVFFIENDVKLTGQQSKGYGIMVIRSGGALEYEGALEVAGNFEWNGLIIFENAFDFDGRGTPTLNGSIVVGNTDNQEDTINIDIGGNIEINYDCEAEQYAKMAAADAVKQNKYSRIVSTENIRYPSSGNNNANKSIIDKIKGLL
ncbi:MAG: hypothetical protein EA390_13145 [Balneolaceae bacterium]|nr:MAG: hypothetical protein EA390_13145 [Balneolaceae bacterium]